MKKYRLSAKGLKRLFDKMMAVGLITQADIDQRSLAYQEHTVTLTEDVADLGAELEYSGPVRPQRRGST